MHNWPPCLGPSIVPGLRNAEQLVEFARAFSDPDVALAVDVCDEALSLLCGAFARLGEAVDAAEEREREKVA